MKKKLKKSHVDDTIIKMEAYIAEPRIVQEIEDTEKEFGMIVTNAWEVIIQYPSLHKNVLKTAQKLRELKILMKQQNLVDQSIH